MTETSLLAGQGALSEYYDWFAASRPGDILVYWRGDLNADREFAPDSSVVDTTRNAACSMSRNSFNIGLALAMSTPKRSNS